METQKTINVYKLNFEPLIDILPFDKIESGYFFYVNWEDILNDDFIHFDFLKEIYAEKIISLFLEKGFELKSKIFKNGVSFFCIGNTPCLDQEKTNNIYKMIKENEGMTFSACFKQSGISMSLLKKILNNLVQNGFIKSEKYINLKGGRPTTRYTIV